MGIDDESLISRQVLHKGSSSRDPLWDSQEPYFDKKRTQSQKYQFTTNGCGRRLLTRKYSELPIEPKPDGAQLLSIRKLDTLETAIKSHSAPILHDTASYNGEAQKSLEGEVSKERLTCDKDRNTLSENINHQSDLERKNYFFASHIAAKASNEQKENNHNLRHYPNSVHFNESLNKHPALPKIYGLNIVEYESDNIKQKKFSRGALLEVISRIELVILAREYTASDGSTKRQLSRVEKKIFVDVQNLKKQLKQNESESSTLSFEEISQAVLVFKKSFERLPNSKENGQLKPLFRSLQLEFMRGWSFEAYEKAYQQLKKDLGYLSEIGSDYSEYVNSKLNIGVNTVGLAAKVGLKGDISESFALDEQGLTFHAKETVVGFESKLGFSAEKYPVLAWLKLKLGIGYLGNIPLKKVFKVPLSEKRIDTFNRFDERKDTETAIRHDLYKKFASAYEHSWYSPKNTIRNQESKLYKKSYKATNSQYFYWLSPSTILNRAKRFFHLDQSSILFHEQHIRNAANNEEVFKTQLAHVLNIIDGEEKRIELLDQPSEYEEPLKAVYTKKQGYMKADVGPGSAQGKWTQYHAEQVVMMNAWETLRDQSAGIKTLGDRHSKITDNLIGQSGKKIFTIERLESLIRNAYEYVGNLEKIQKDPFNNQLRNYLAQQEQLWVPGFAANDDSSTFVRKSTPTMLCAFSEMNKVFHCINRKMVEEGNIDQDLSQLESKLAEITNRYDEARISLEYDYYKMIIRSKELDSNKFLVPSDILPAELGLQPRNDTHNHISIERYGLALKELDQHFESLTNLVRQLDAVNDRNHRKQALSVLASLGEGYWQTQGLFNKPKKSQAGLNGKTEQEIVESISDIFADIVFVNAELGLRIKEAFELSSNECSSDFEKLLQQVDANASKFQKPNINLNPAYFQLKSSYAFSAKASIDDKELELRLTDPLGLVSAGCNIKKRERPQHPNKLREGDLLSVNLFLDGRAGIVGSGLVLGHALERLWNKNKEGVNSHLSSMAGISASAALAEIIERSVLGMPAWSDLHLNASVQLNFEAIKPSLYELEAFKQGKLSLVQRAVDNQYVTVKDQVALEDLKNSHGNLKTEWAYLRLKEGTSQGVSLSVPGLPVSPGIAFGTANTHVIHEKIFSNSLAYVVRQLAHIEANYQGAEQIQRIEHFISQKPQKDFIFLEDRVTKGDQVNIGQDFLDIFSAMHRPKKIRSLESGVLSQASHLNPPKTEFSEIFFEVGGYLSLVEKNNRDKLLEKLSSELQHEEHAAVEDKANTLLLEDYFKYAMISLVKNLYESPDSTQLLVDMGYDVNLIGSISPSPELQQKIKSLVLQNKIQAKDIENFLLFNDENKQSFEQIQRLEATEYLLKLVKEDVDKQWTEKLGLDEASSLKVLNVLTGFGKSYFDAVVLQLAFEDFWRESFDHSQSDSKSVLTAKSLLIQIAKMVRPVLKTYLDAELQPIAEGVFPETHTLEVVNADPKMLPRLPQSFEKV